MQSAEQRHQSRWHMKKEARIDEGSRQRSLLRRALHVARWGAGAPEPRVVAGAKCAQPEPSAATIEGRGGGGGPRASRGTAVGRSGGSCSGEGPPAPPAPPAAAARLSWREREEDDDAAIVVASIIAAVLMSIIATVQAAGVKWVYVTAIH